MGSLAMHDLPEMAHAKQARALIMDFMFPAVVKVVATKMKARRQNVSMEKQMPRESLN